MAVSEISASTQDYLKCIWTLQEWTGDPVSITALAERLGIRTSTASDGVKKLVQLGFVEHETYGGVILTKAGRAHAVAMVRRHRLLETYLAQELGYDWDQVHDEAEVLEHAVSDRLMAAIDSRLGFPTRDPHGDPIPSADGSAHLPDAVVLADAEPGEYTVARISDADPAQLRRLALAGVTLDAAIAVDHERNARASDVSLAADDAKAIWVTRA